MDRHLSVHENRIVQKEKNEGGKDRINTNKWGGYIQRLHNSNADGKKTGSI